MAATTGLRGSWVAVPTPMRADGTVRIDGFRELIDRQAENGTSALLVTGSAGEVSTLTADERRAIIAGVAPYCLDKIPVYFGTTCSTTAETIELTRFTEDAGAAGCVLTVPAYSLPTQRSILEFLLEVAGSTRMNVAIYNNPSRTGKSIRPETVAALHRAAPNFVADKEATADPAQIQAVLEQTDRSLPVLACDNPSYALFCTAVTLADGMANITGNIHPAEMAYLARPFDDRTDLDEWKDRFFGLLPLMRAAYWLPNPVVIKAALNILGFDVGPVRKPLQDLEGDRLETLHGLLADLPSIARGKAA